MPETFFNLGEGETVVKDIKPEGKLKWYFFIKEGLAISILMAIMLPGLLLSLFASLILKSEVSSFLGGYLIFAGASFIFGFFIGYIIAALRYRKQHYWITNKRVIYKRGLIGYRVTSIPYERISDIIISRSFLERIFGFGSLHVQTLAGQMTGRSRMGAEGVLLAIPDPEGTQELIFKLAKEKRKVEKITF